jgi:hypothetical protein
VKRKFEKVSEYKLITFLVTINIVAFIVLILVLTLM